VTVEAIGTPAGFEHEALFYRGDADFVGAVGAVVRAGLAADEAVAVALPGPHLELLRTCLDDAAAAVTWLDMAEVGANPARIIDVWTTILHATQAAGRRLLGVGEPAFVGRRPAELVECALHERLLDRAFAGGPAWRLVCPYDEAHLPPEVCADARRTHAGTGTDEEHRTAFAAPLPPPRSAVLRGDYRAGDVPAVRRTVRHWAASLGLAVDRQETLELAAAELATNGIRHGGGSGSVAMWTEGGAAVLEFTDTGCMTEPLVGRRRPPADQLGGRGLYLVNQLCDLVQVRSSPAGTTVRVLTWL
jgi:anti-sigma regulatory factor (Ser/Thr protein kinase)